MTILAETARILDLPENVVIEEAKAKLVETVLFVNGKRVYITGMDKTILVVHTVDHKQETLASGKVEKMEVWLPETGIYQHPTLGPLYVQRIPNRQWRRSFNNQLYKITTLQGKIITDFVWAALELDPSSRVDFYKDKNGFVFYHKTRVGYFEDKNTFICTFPELEHEVRAWLT